MLGGRLKFSFVYFSWDAMRNRFVFVTRKAACFASEMRFVAQFRDYCRYFPRKQKLFLLQKVQNYCHQEYCENEEKNSTAEKTSTVRGSSFQFWFFSGSAWLEPPVPLLSEGILTRLLIESISHPPPSSITLLEKLKFPTNYKK